MEQGDFDLFGKPLAKERKELVSKFDQEVIKKLAARRYELQRTQEYMNHKIGCADRLINKWECGTRLPSAFSLWCWVTSLGGRIEFVWENDDV